VNRVQAGQENVDEELRGNFWKGKGGSVRSERGRRGEGGGRIDGESLNRRKYLRNDVLLKLHLHFSEALRVKER